MERSDFALVSSGLLHLFFGKLSSTNSKKYLAHTWLKSADRNEYNITTNNFPIAFL